MSTAAEDLPVDETSRAVLAEQGLTLALVDTADRDAYAPWHRSVARGFLDTEQTDEEVTRAHESLRGSRLVGVHDATSPDPAAPVATSEGWVAPLTVPGGADLPAWAISAVTVSPTHRRRGIARALLEAELRTAAALGCPVATLTVSESTIYGRYGFSPAALARNLTIDTRRVTWSAPAPPGQVHFVTAEQLRDEGHAIVERVRLRTPGQVGYDAASILWTRQIGLGVADDASKRMRRVRYDDADGAPQGFCVYTATENPDDFTQSTVAVTALVAATSEAYAALWRFVLELDLVTTVTAHLRPVDEPLRWMVGDFRSMHVDEFDHLWTRVLDVPAALGSRTYDAGGRLVLRVTDPLGFADGTWSLDVDATGTAAVVATDEPADVTLTVGALSSLHLGGVPAGALEAAGTLTGDAARVDAVFRSAVAPYVGIWF